MMDGQPIPITTDGGLLTLYFLNKGTYLDPVEYFIHDFQSLVLELHILDLEEDNVNQHELDP